MTAKTNEGSEHFIARVLIIANDLGWNNILTPHLNRCGFDVRSAMGYEEGRYLLLTSSFDFVLLRLECMAIEQILEKKNLSMPLLSCHLIVMATDQECTSPSRFLDNGADDYFHISYPPAEIISRLHAIQRRRAIGSEGVARFALIKVNQPSLRFSFCGWTLDCAKSKLYNRDGIQVPLTRGEYRILSKLASSQGIVQTRTALTYAFNGQISGRYHRTADTAISRLRRKLLKYGSEELIQSVPKKGYKLAVAAAHISNE